MILAGFSYDPKICNFKFQNEFKMKLFRGFQGIMPLQFSFINPRMSPNTLKLAFKRCFILGNGLPAMKNLPAKNRELGNLIKAAIRMMLLDGHTELGFGNCTFYTSGTIHH